MLHLVVWVEFSMIVPAGRMGLSLLYDHNIMYIYISSLIYTRYHVPSMVISMVVVSAIQTR